jgi:hypothetical protein
MSVVTLPDVEILRVGNWHSSLTGQAPITGADIDEMLLAATDREVDRAPLRFGHVDPRFDGEPAAGWVTNLRRRGDVLVGDVEGVPATLAEMISAGFKRRSAEIAWKVRTASGKTYGAALAGLALLGVTPPAVKGLADIVSRYSGSTHFSTVTTEVSTMPTITVDQAAYEELQRHAAAAPALIAQARLLGQPRRAEDTLAPTTFAGVPITGAEPTEEQWEDFEAGIGIPGRRRMGRPLGEVWTGSPFHTPAGPTPSDANFEAFERSIGFRGRPHLNTGRGPVSK